MARTIASLICATSLAVAAAACGKHDYASPLSPTGVTAAAAGAAASPGSNVSLDAVRQATARFHNMDAAFAAGYEDDGYGCIDATTFGLDPSAGGMGFHLINNAYHADADVEIDPLRPDLLVYGPAKGGAKPQLVALEYEVFASDWYALKGANAAPPSLFGHEFERIDFDGMILFGLHVWIWQDNPSGMFEDFNPRVSLCQ
jgi:hypothetical protein